MADRKEAKTDRRNFLKLASIGTVAGAAAAVAGVDVAKAAAPVSGKDAGYRETDHVKSFYDSARF